MKIVKILGVIAVLIIILAVASLGYLGFVPGISNIMGANSPRDLGVKYTSEDLQRARSKLGQLPIWL